MPVQRRQQLLLIRLQFVGQANGQLIEAAEIRQGFCRHFNGSNEAVEGVGRQLFCQYLQELAFCKARL